jgi:small-conductance mechanosensitive channel
MEFFDISALTPGIGVFVGLVISLWAKDLAASLAKGLAFRFTPLFKEGDMVVLEDTPAIIVKIGYKTTIFGVTNKDGDYLWRIVPNANVESLKIEKVVRPAPLKKNP